MAKKYFQDYKLVATEVGNAVPILKQTSCMSPERRFEIACSWAFRKYFSTNEKFNKFLEKKAEPTLALLGFSEWPRDILTDMGLRVTFRSKTVSLKGLRKKK